MKGSYFHQANMLAEKVLQEVKNVQDSFSIALETSQDDYDGNKESPPSLHSANSISGDMIQL